MVLKRDLVQEKCWYPPTCKAHVKLLSMYCSNRKHDYRNALTVLTDIDYHVVHKNGRGNLMGYSHDRIKPLEEFVLNIQNSDTRESIHFKDIVKIERVGSVPIKYKK